MRGHKDLKPEEICAVVDTREQLPLELHLPWVKDKLETGDYSVRGLERFVTVERKSLSDLIGCIGQDRERFEACIQRMRAYETAVIVIEASWPDIYRGDWQATKIKPGHVKGALYSWMEQKISVILAHDREIAAGVVSGVLFSAARHRWEQVQPFMGGLKLVPRGTVVASKGAAPSDPPSQAGCGHLPNPPGTTESDMQTQTMTREKPTG